MASLRACMGAAFLAGFVAKSEAALRGSQTHQPFLVKLWKEHARDAEGEEHTFKPDHGGGYFIGAIWVGGPEPQELHVAFSTSVGMVTLPGSDCADTSCKEHHRYSPTMSQTSSDIQENGRPVDPKGGRRAPVGAKRDSTELNFMTTSKGGNGGISGEFVSDDLCLGDRVGNKGLTPQPICANMRLVVAKKMTEETFRSRPQDGMVGLAPNGGLSLNEHFNFVSKLKTEGLLPQFGFFVSDDAHSAEITFGGHDASKVESSLEWVDVIKPEVGHWLVPIKGIRLGGVQLKMCEEGCRGVVHTSSPKMVVPEGMGPVILDPLKEFESPKSGGCRLPGLSIELVGGVTLELEAEDYAGPDCTAEVITHGMKDQELDGEHLIVLGEPLLRRYYTVFDWEKKRVAFGRAAVERSCPRLSSAGFSTSPTSCSGYVEPSVVDEPIVLFQHDMEV